MVESKDFLLDDVQASKLELERWAKAAENPWFVWILSVAAAMSQKRSSLRSLWRARYIWSRQRDFRRAISTTIKFPCRHKQRGGSCRLVRARSNRGHGLQQLQRSYREAFDRKGRVIKAVPDIATSAISITTLKIAALTQQKTGVPISVHTQMAAWDMRLHPI